MKNKLKYILEEIINKLDGKSYFYIELPSKFIKTKLLNKFIINLVIEMVNKFNLKTAQFLFDENLDYIHKVYNENLIPENIELLNEKLLIIKISPNNFNINKLSQYIQNILLSKKINTIIFNDIRIIDDIRINDKLSSLARENNLNIICFNKVSDIEEVRYVHIN